MTAPTPGWNPIAGISTALGLPPAVEAVLCEFPLDETGHVAACGYDDDPIGSCRCSSLPQRIARALTAHVPPAADPGSCSQCGERSSSMVKIGTTDGWCTVCLDEAAEPVDGVQEGIRLAAQLARDHVLGETGEKVARFLEGRSDRGPVVTPPG